MVHNSNHWIMIISQTFVCDELNMQVFEQIGVGIHAYLDDIDGLNQFLAFNQQQVQSQLAFLEKLVRVEQQYTSGIQELCASYSNQSSSSGLSRRLASWSSAEQTRPSDREHQKRFDDCWHSWIDELQTAATVRSAAAKELTSACIQPLRKFATSQLPEPSTKLSRLRKQIVELGKMQVSFQELHRPAQMLLHVPA